MRSQTPQTSLSTIPPDSQLTMSPTSPTPANHRVEKFDSSGNFILMFGQGVNSGTGNPNVCTNAGAPTDVCQSGTSSSSPGGFQTPTFVAVDGSASLSAGDVYIGDTGDNLVSKFDSSGNLVASWGTGGQLSGFSSLAGIAVDPSGNLWVYNQGGDIFSSPKTGVSSPSGTRDAASPALGSPPIPLATSMLLPAFLASPSSLPPASR